MLNAWISLPALLLLIVAHSAPVVTAWIAGPRASWPLDLGKVLGDGERLLGAHKTWRGVLVAAAAAGLTARLLGLPPWAGAGFGVAAMAGDALSSFAKRRLRLGPGAWVPGLDQVPEALLPLIACWRVLELDLMRLAGTLLAFSLLAMLASRTLGSSRKPDSP